MRPAESFVGQPIRSLQTMLRVLAEHDDRYYSVIPDGIYGPEVIKAVSIFQRLHGLPITGVTDLHTWERVVEAYLPALTDQGRAQILEILLEPGQVIGKDQEDPLVYLIQGMLMGLAQRYHSISEPSFSGQMDPITQQSLASFQALCCLPATGTLDKETWKHLALHYPIAANR